MHESDVEFVKFLLSSLEDKCTLKFSELKAYIDAEIHSILKKIEYVEKDLNRIEKLTQKEPI